MTVFADITQDRWNFLQAFLKIDKTFDRKIVFQDKNKDGALNTETELFVVLPGAGCQGTEYRSVDNTTRERINTMFGGLNLYSGFFKKWQPAIDAYKNLSEGDEKQSLKSLDDLDKKVDCSESRDTCINGNDATRLAIILESFAPKYKDKSVNVTRHLYRTSIELYLNAKNYEAVADALARRFSHIRDDEEFQHGEAEKSLVHFCNSDQLDRAVAFINAVPEDNLWFLQGCYFGFECSKKAAEWMQMLRERLPEAGMVYGLSGAYLHECSAEDLNSIEFAYRKAIGLSHSNWHRSRYAEKLIDALGGTDLPRALKVADMANGWSIEDWYQLKSQAFSGAKRFQDAIDNNYQLIAYYKNHENEYSAVQVRIDTALLRVVRWEIELGHMAKAADIYLTLGPASFGLNPTEKAIIDEELAKRANGGRTKAKAK